MSDRMYDVIVIGAGVVGSRIAACLAKHRYNVLVVEQKTSVADSICCTGIVSEKCVSEFDIEDRWVLRRVSEVVLVTPSGKSIRVNPSRSVAVILDREAFTIGMADRAMSERAEYLFNTKASDINTEPDKVRVQVYHHGESEWLEARAVILAGGFNCGLGEAQKFRVDSGYFGAQVEVDVPPSDVEVYFSQAIAPGFFAWLVPIGNDRAKVGLLCRYNPIRYLKGLLDKLSAEGKIVGNYSRPVYGGVPMKALSRAYSDRMLVVGTMAGQVKPTTGGGIYYGLLCADIAVEVLHKALSSDNLSASNLAEYQRKWLARLGKEIRIGYVLRKFYESLSDADIEKLLGKLDTSRVDNVDFDWHGNWLVRQFLLNPPIGLLKPVLKAYLRFPT